MKHWRRILVCVLALYLLGLGVGYIRLPFAAIKSLGNYRSIASAPAVTFADTLDASASQRWYLEQSFTESPVPVVPVVSAAVQWNLLVVARANSRYYVGPKGAERRDSLYLCLFGAWVPVYTFGGWVS